MDDLEKLKQELKAELLEELKVEGARKSVPGLEAIRKKWFNGTDIRNKYNDSEMYKRFGNDQHKIWDHVRGITRIVFGVKNQARLSIVDQEKLEKVCDDLCQIICDLREEINEEA